jgi:hypothetical protein
MSIYYAAPLIKNRNDRKQQEHTVINIYGKNFVKFTEK